MTRPLEAPRSTAAYAFTVVHLRPRAASTSVRSSQEGGRDAGVNGDVKAGGVAEVGGAEHEHGVRHILGQHLALEQRALRVVLAQIFLRHAVDGGWGAK